jgi:hypothetical protein
MTTFVADAGEPSKFGRFGFYPDPVDPADLPARRDDVSNADRERAALIVLAISYGHCPEDIVRGITPRVLRAFNDEIYRAEAVAHVDLVLDAIAPAQRG